ncbi:hypothetical protein HDU86_008298 [Geranomyces michiganensis]|nr:hypothetical protein HDU86_008298 [Geranomyces michiganensis]
MLRLSAGAENASSSGGCPAREELGGDEDDAPPPEERDDDDKDVCNAAGSAKSGMEVSAMTGMDFGKG